MNARYLTLATVLVVAVAGAANGKADTLVLSTHASQQVLSCFQGTFNGYVASYEGDVFNVYVPLVGCGGKAIVPVNCGPQVVASERLPAEIRNALPPLTQVLHQKLTKEELTSVNFGGAIQGQCVVPSLGSPKKIRRLPEISWIAPAASPELVTSIDQFKNRKLRLVNWASAGLQGKRLETGNEFTFTKTDFQSSGIPLLLNEQIAVAGAVGFEKFPSTYVVLGATVKDIGVETFTVQLDQIDSMTFLAVGTSLPTPQMRVDPLQVVAEIVKTARFDWDAEVGAAAGVQVNPQSILIINGKRQIRVQSNLPIDGALTSIRRRP